jgi:amino acid transporter
MNGDTVSALDDAIAGALASPARPVGPPTTTGLDRRRLSALPVAAQAVANVAPSPGMMAASGMVAWLGVAVVPVYLLATLAMLLVGSCVAQFARRMAAAGSLYTFVAKGLTPRAAFLTGCALLLAYLSLVGMCLLGSSRRLATLLADAGLIAAVDQERTVALLTVLLGGTLATCVVRGIQISAMVTLTLEAASVCVVLTALVVTAYRGVGMADILAAPDLTISAVTGALMIAITGLVGFESGCALSVEARRPYAVVPRVVFWTPAVCGALMLVAAGLHIYGFSRHQGGSAVDGSALDGRAVAEVTPLLPVLLQLGLVSSLFACAMASANAAVRVLFSMGREQVTPPVFGRIHPRYRTPYVAAATVIPVAVLTPGALWLAGLPSRSISSALSILATQGFLLTYVLVCLAMPVFLRRIGEHTRWASVTGLLGASLLTAVFTGFWVETVRDGKAWLVAVFAALLALSLLWFGRVRRRVPDVSVGFFDEATFDDILPGASPAGRD